MKKVMIVIPCWMRNKILHLTITQLNEFCEANAHLVNIGVVYILSANDPELSEHIQNINAASHEHYIVFSDNELLGRKLNDGIKLALAIGCDYIMNLGSDDLLHPDLIKLYMPFIEMEIPLFGLKYVYFWQPDQHAFLFDYYNGYHIVGAGRMIHKTVIKKIGDLYPQTINRGMDTASANNILQAGYRQMVVHYDYFPYVVDVKSEININAFDDIFKAAQSKKFYQNSDIDLNDYFKNSLDKFNFNE